MSDHHFLNLSDDEGFTNVLYHNENHIFWILTVALTAEIPFAIFFKDIQAAIIIGAVVIVGISIYVSLIGENEWNEKLRAFIYTKNKRTKRKIAGITLAFLALSSLVWLLILFLTNKPLTPALVMLFPVSIASIGVLIRIAIKRSDIPPLV